MLCCVVFPISLKLISVKHVFLLGPMDWTYFEMIKSPTQKIYTKPNPPLSLSQYTKPNPPPPLSLSLTPNDTKQNKSIEEEGHSNVNYFGAYIYIHIYIYEKYYVHNIFTKIIGG